MLLGDVKAVDVVQRPSHVSATTEATSRTRILVHSHSMTASRTDADAMRVRDHHGPGGNPTPRARWCRSSAVAVQREPAARSPDPPFVAPRGEDA